MTRLPPPASAAKPRWGLVATVKAPPALLEAFLTWHFGLGATRISLYFDEPEDPAYEICRSLAGPERLSLYRCDRRWWEKRNGRPERHQNRQSKNARHAYHQPGLDWIGHIDADEFLHSREDLAALLASLPEDQIQCRAEPFEAMHDPSLPPGPLAAWAFRGALKPRHAALRKAVLEEAADLLPEAMLSHSAGKAFFRCGIADLSPRLHGAFMHGSRLPGPPFQPGLHLLHFHAQDRDAWLRALPFRLTRGAYQYHPELQAFLSTATATEIARFYDQSQILTPEKTALLQAAGRLVQCEQGKGPGGGLQL